MKRRSPKQEPLDDPTRTAPLAHLGALAPTGLRKPWALRWKDGEQTRTHRLLDRITVGSAPSEGLTLADTTVSRFHAELSVRDDEVWVRDLGSRNGTYVESVRVAEARVLPGQRIRVGESLITLERGTDTQSVELWPADRMDGLVGRSEVMRGLFRSIVRVASSAASVLIQGETGSGKELVARTIHDRSMRHRGPYIVVDCGSIPETLIEAELFGYARGAFTGAAREKCGALESAHGGTLFLDEIGELPLSMQPKLLRFLETKQVRRLGETEVRSVDVRVVSATHRDLRTMVNEGTFREDLYFRVAVLPLRVPPLRERREDIPLLIEEFARAHGSLPIEPRLIEELQARPWPGNVRQLRHVIERWMVFGMDHDAFEEEDAWMGPTPTLGLGIDIDVPYKEARGTWVARFEAEYVRALLARHEGNVSRMARAAGIDRTYVHRLLRKHGLES